VAGQDKRKRQQQRSTNNPANERADITDVAKSQKLSSLFVVRCMAVARNTGSGWLILDTTGIQACIHTRELSE
jgi:hypothetical protein